MNVEKMQKADFSGYISVLPLIENLMSPQKSPLRVLHNLHINYMDEEINHLALWVYYFDVQIHVNVIVLMMFSLSTND